MCVFMEDIWSGGITVAWFVDTRTKGPRVLSSGIWQSVLFCSDVLIGSQNRSKLSVR